MKKLMISGKDVSDYILDWQEDAEFSDTLIGNVVVKQFTIKLDNENAGVTDWSNITVETTYKDGTETKTASQALTLTEKPERYSEDVTLTLYDRLYKTGKKYHSKLSYPATISAIIAEIDSDIDTSTLPDSLINRKVGKISGATKRDVLGYIAECAGCNVYCGANDKVRFSHASMTYTTARTFDYASAFDVNRKITINRVGLDASDDEFYDVKNGKEDTTTPDSETLFLNPENPLVTQADCAYIYGILGGKTVYSFKSFSTIKETGIDTSIGLLDEIRPGTCIRYYTGTDGEKYGDAALMVMSAKRTEGAGDSEAAWDLEGDLKLTHEDVVKQARTRKDTDSKIKDVSDKVDKLQETVSSGGGGTGGTGSGGTNDNKISSGEALSNGQLLLTTLRTKYIQIGQPAIDCGAVVLGSDGTATVTKKYSLDMSNILSLRNDRVEALRLFGHGHDYSVDAESTSEIYSCNDVPKEWLNLATPTENTTGQAGGYIKVGDTSEQVAEYNNNFLPLVFVQTLTNTPLTTGTGGDVVTRLVTVDKIGVTAQTTGSNISVSVQFHVTGQGPSAANRIVLWAIIWPSK